MGDITKDFSLREFENTSHAEYRYLNVITDPDIRDNIVALCKTVLQPLRDVWGKPLLVSSGYRCYELNKAVGGVENSQHRVGEAADILAENSCVLASLAQVLELPFDQMILYPTFVHFSHKKGGTQRGQILYNKTYKGQRL